jgi:cell division FtsZ-interacting protein ZapD
MSFPPVVMISDALFCPLLEELDVYQEKLQVWEASPQVTEPVRRLVEMLRKYQHVLTTANPEPTLKRRFFITILNRQR